MKLIEYKEIGITMKQFLEKIKKKYPNKKLTFTARLDPMAHGIVPLIEENEFKNIKNNINSKKVYQVKILLGIQTDSDDVLGLIEKVNKNYFNKNLDKLKPYLERYNYNYDQKYHYFSSKRIIKRYRNKKDDGFTHNVTLYKSKIISEDFIFINKLINDICSDIKKIDPEKNFRQKEILKQWKDFYLKYENQKINYIKLELTVSSGFYIRQFVRDLINETQIPMLAYQINRTNIL